MNAIKKCTREVHTERKLQPRLQLVLSPPIAFSKEGESGNDKEQSVLLSVEEPEKEKNPFPGNSFKRAKTSNCSEVVCCNCNSISKEWTKLQDLATFRFFNITARKVRNERMMVLDVLRSLYEFEKDDLGALNDPENGSIMCTTCMDSLKQLYQLYTGFISLSVLSNAILSNILIQRRLKEKVSTSKTKTSYSNKKKLSKQEPSSKSPAKPKRKQKSTKLRTNEPNAETKPIKSNNPIIESDLSNVNQDSESNLDAPLEICEFPQDSQDAPTGDDGNDDTELKYKCDQCQRCFKSHVALKVHLASHLREDKNFTCKDCAKGFRTQKALDWHHQVDHDGHKPFECSYEGCGKRFRLKKKLLLHFKVMHEKRKPYPCPKCEKSFRTKYDLKVHDVGKHVQGDNSVGCSKCRRKFPSRHELEKHVVSHEEEKPHKCSVCLKGFQSISRLNLHSKSHDEIPSFICSVCGKAYKHKRDLLLHEIVHQDESNFRFGCGDCSRRFYRIDLLRNHQSNESHFSPETIGPSISKFNKNMDKGKKPKSQTQNVLSAEVQRKRAKKTRKKSSKPEESGPVSEFPTLVTVETDSSFATNTSDGLEFTPFPLPSSNIFSESGTSSGVPRDQISLSSLKGDVFAGNGSDSTLSLQPISILSLPNENGTILSISKEASDRNLPTFDISAGAEQIGIDVIHAFINNYN